MFNNKLLQTIHAAPREEYSRVNEIMVVGKAHVRVAVSASQHHRYHHTIVASIVVVIAMIVVVAIPVRVHHASVSKPDRFA